MSKKIGIFFVLMFIAGIGAAFYLLREAPKSQNTNDPYLTLFKSRCEVFQKSPYHNSELNFSIEFTNDHIVCLLKDQISGSQEVYIWQKDVFESNAINTQLQNAILGKISVNSQDPGETRTIETFSTNIDNEQVAGEIVLPKNCISNDCPRAKKVTLQRNGKDFIIEEFNESINLFANIHFK